MNNTFFYLFFFSTSSEVHEKLDQFSSMFGLSKSCLKTQWNKHCKIMRSFAHVKDQFAWNWSWAGLSPK